jgi:hypothetical protein
MGLRSPAIEKAAACDAILRRPADIFNIARKQDEVD